MRFYPLQPGKSFLWYSWLMQVVDFKSVVCREWLSTTTDDCQLLWLVAVAAAASLAVDMAFIYADNRASFARAPLPTYFRLFTKESLTKIERRIRDERQAKALVKQLQEQGDPAAAAAGPRDDLQPNPQLEAGRTLPSRLGEFPPELYGKPIEELDDFYHNKYVRISSTLTSCQ